VGVPEEILLKPDKLTSNEWELIKRHTVVGSRILAGSKIPMMRMAREIALSHHEKCDGSGYPSGLSRESIPESARIVSIVEPYDALTHSTPYRGAFPEEKAVSLMRAYVKTAFDPRVFDYFVTLLPQMRAIREELADEEGESRGSCRLE